MWPCVWLLSLSIVFSRSIHVVTWVGASFLFMAAQHLTVQTLQYLAGGRLGGFYFSSTVNNTAMNIHRQGFVWTHISIASLTVVFELGKISHN